MGLKRDEMSTVAEQLRLARESKKLTVYQVAEVTKIRTDHIRALEEGNFNVFSAPVYIRGFVRTYALLLKLDTPQIMTALDDELGRTDKFREPPPLTEPSGRALNFITLQLSKLNRRAVRPILIGILALVLLIVVIAIWRSHKPSDPLANLPPGTYQPAQSGETLPLPPAPAHHP
jgi:cytoskeletal protein RodZ